MLAPPGQRRLYQIFLTHVALADEINLDAGARGQTLRILAQTVPKRLGELRVIENPHLPRVQIGGHSLGVADLRQRAKNQHSIPTPQHACDLVLQSLRQQFDAHPGIISDLFGSGYAGLGYCRWGSPMPRTRAELPPRSQITDYISLGVLAKTF